MSKLSLRMGARAARKGVEEPRLKFSDYGVFQDRKTELQRSPTNPELKADSGSKWQIVEEELLTLQALKPELTEDLPLLFEEAVTDSLADTLGENEARALVILMGVTDFGSPAKVFQVLDTFFHGESSILKDAITKEFHMNVRLLSKKVKRGFLSRDWTRRRIQRMSRRWGRTSSILFVSPYWVSTDPC